MSYSLNSSFLFSKSKKENNDSKGVNILTKASWEDFTCRKNHATILNGIKSLIIPYFPQN